MAFLNHLPYLLSFFPLFLSLGRAASLPPSLIPFDESSIRDSSFPNGTVFGAIDPAKFQMQTNYPVDAKLPATSILMTAVDTMVEVAILDWNGQMPPTAFAIDDPKYSQVEFFISAPTPDAQIQNAYAVLGIFLVMNEKLSSPLTRFRASFHRFYYNRQLVCSLEVRKRQGGSTNTNSEVSEHSSDGKTGDVDAEVNDVTTASISAPAWQDPRLEVTIVPGPDAFTIYEAFYSVYALIREVAIGAAQFPTWAPVTDFTVTISTPPITTPGNPITASFGSVGSRTRGNPPYFESKWLIKALGQLPGRMLDSRRFLDVVQMGIKVDGIFVGKGYIVRQRRSEAAVATS
ncbi:MAG: hypothetical protein Q9226_005325 [Calogaya cf. arnoldii]